MIGVESHVFVVAAALAAVVLCGCASTPRIVEVSSTQREMTVERADKNLLLTDRASILLFQAQPLPVADQREEFLVNWKGAGVDLIKFEYRQVNVPDQIMEQESSPSRHGWNMFEVRGEKYVSGGPVSAWRVTLWRTGQILAEKRSALW
jgi:hypothetical protein